MKEKDRCKKVKNFVLTPFLSLDMFTPISMVVTLTYISILVLPLVLPWVNVGLTILIQEKVSD